MLALLLKAMAEESIRASVSHEATRQLLVGTGLLGVSVEAPEWVQFGTASFFETPVGAFWPGIGAPHWTYMVKFKLWKKEDQKAETPDAQGRVPDVEKKLDTPDVAIRSVITDKYFRDAREEEKKSLQTKARTMTWALTYFLMNKKLDGLLRYYGELQALPRDMVPDDDTLMRCFGRAFELMDHSDPSRVDDNKLAKLAEEWYSFIDLTPMESSEALQEAWRNLKSMGDKSRSRTGRGAGEKPSDAVKPNLPPFINPDKKPPADKPKDKGK
jgi:hypothetical protein